MYDRNRVAEALHLSMEKHRTPSKAPNRSEARNRLARQLTPDTQIRRTASPMLDRYNNTIERVERKLRTLLNEKDRISRDSAKKYEDQREHSCRMAAALREAQNAVRLLETDNRELQHTLMINNRRWEEEYEAVSRELEAMRMKYHTMMAARSKTYEFAESPRRPSISKEERQKAFLQNTKSIEYQKQITNLKTINASFLKQVQKCKVQIEQLRLELSHSKQKSLLLESKIRQRTIKGIQDSTLTSVLKGHQRTTSQDLTSEIARLKNSELALKTSLVRIQSEYAVLRNHNALLQEEIMKMKVHKKTDGKHSIQSKSSPMFAAAEQRENRLYEAQRDALRKQVQYLLKEKASIQAEIKRTSVPVDHKPHIEEPQPQPVPSPRVPAQPDPTLTKQCDELRLKVSQLQSQINQLTETHKKQSRDTQIRHAAQMQTSKDQIVKLDAENKRLTKLADDHSKVMRQSEKILDQHRLCVEKVDSQAAELKRLLKQLDDENKNSVDLNGRLEQARKEVEFNEEKFNRAKSDLEHQIAEVDKARKQAQSQLGVLKKHSDDEIARLKSLLEDAEAQNNDEEKKARDLKEAVEQQLQIKIREIKGNFDKQLDDREKIIKQLEIDFEAEKKKCEDLVRQLQILQKKLQDANREIVQLFDSKKSNSEELQVLRAKITKLQADIKHLQKVIEQKDKQIAELKSHKTEELVKVEHGKEDIEKLRLKLVEDQAQLESDRKQLIAQKQKFESEKKELVAQKASFEAQKSHLQNIKKENEDQLTKAKEQFQSEKAEFKLASDLITQQHNFKDEDLIKRSHQIQNGFKELDKAKALFLSQRQAQKTALQQDYIAFSKKVEDLEQKQKVLALRQTELDSDNQAIEKYRQQLDDRRKQIDEERKKIDEDLQKSQQPIEPIDPSPSPKELAVLRAQYEALIDEDQLLREDLARTQAALQDQKKRAQAAIDEEKRLLHQATKHSEGLERRHEAEILAQKAQKVASQNKLHQVQGKLHDTEASLKQVEHSFQQAKRSFQNFKLQSQIDRETAKMDNQAALMDIQSKIEASFSKLQNDHIQRIVNQMSQLQSKVLHLSQGLIKIQDLIARSSSNNWEQEIQAALANLLLIQQRHKEENKLQEEMQADLDTIQEQLEIRMNEDKQQILIIQGIREAVLGLGLDIGEYKHSKDEGKLDGLLEQINNIENILVRLEKTR